MSQSPSTEHDVSVNFGYIVTGQSNRLYIPVEVDLLGNANQADVIFQVVRCEIFMIGQVLSLIDLGFVVSEFIGTGVNLDELGRPTADRERT